MDDQHERRSLEESSSDSQIELDELQQAALTIPDSEAGQEQKSATAAEQAVIASRGSVAAPIQDQPPSGPLVGSGENGEWELQDWLRLYGQSLGVASTATSTGFTVARGVTDFSLGLAKRFTQAAVALPAMLIDSANGNVPGGQNATFSAVAHSSVGGMFDLVSTLALGGIDAGSALTSAGLGAASSGVEGIRRSLGSEVIKSLGQFVKLVQREWNAQNDDLPPGGIPGFGLTGVTRALVVWICIQMVTREYHEKSMLKQLEEIDAVQLRKEIEDEHAEERERETRSRASSNASHLNQIRIAGHADGDRQVVIGEQGVDPSSEGASSFATTPGPLSDKEALKGLLRYSPLVLAVYGGTALAWLGALPKDDPEVDRARRTTSQAQSGRATADSNIPPDGLTREQDEESFLRAAAMMDLTEEEREGEAARMKAGRRARPHINTATGQVIFSSDESAAPGTPLAASSTSAPTTTAATAEVADSDRPSMSSGPDSYSYLDILSGRHDEDIFHRAGNLQPEHVSAGSYLPEPDAPPEPPRSKDSIARPSQPRYYIVTDHKARKIILILRGSLTLGDIAADLTCESREFHFPDPESRPGAKRAEANGGGSSVPFPASNASTSLHSEKVLGDQGAHDDEPRCIVHEGMYETSLAVGSPGAPVHRAVRKALEASPSYALDIAGHSLGGGVASILAILWANPETCLTTVASGLPPGRRLHAYCYACPATMNRELGDRCEGLITTYAYSYDLVCRLSLGSILDIRNAAAWILYEDREEQRRSNGANSNTLAISRLPSGFDPSDRSTPLRVPVLMRRAFEHQAGRLDSDPEVKAQTEQDFLALRRTLEANMRNVELYPPGQVLYIFQAGELLQSHFDPSLSLNSGSTDPAATATVTVTNRQRAFKLRRDALGKPVGRRERVFDQIVFSRRLLSSHMPQHTDLSLRGLE